MSVQKIHVISEESKRYYDLRVTEYRGKYTAILTDKNSGAQYTGKGTLAEGARSGAINAYISAGFGYRLGW